MEIFNDKICVTGDEVLKVIPYNTLMQLCKRNHANRVRRACYNTPALYSIDDFKKPYRDFLYECFPELSDQKLRMELVEQKNIVLDNIVPDPKARNFFDTWEKPVLKQEESDKYYNSAIILNAMRRAWDTMYSARAKQGRKMMTKMEFWKIMSSNENAIHEKYSNSLSWSPRRLQEQAEKYYGKAEDGGNDYSALLKIGKYGNINRVKITSKIERLLISIYGSPEKPFISDVHKQYMSFVFGQIDIVDFETGEIYDRNDFYKDGEPVIISEAAVWKTLNKPVNRRIVDRLRNDFKYNQKHDVYAKRIRPHYSLSKISLDDRDLVRKTLNGEWVHAYYVYDVASGCVIGAAWSLTKDTRLIIECMRDMWKNLKQWNLNTPFEAEIENHLMKELSDKLNNTFMHVTWCAPMNSREKRAEHFNKQKKYYGPESEIAQGMAKGRHNARHEAYLYTREKIFDESNHNYKPVLTPASLEEIIAEDRAQIELYNNARHTNPQKYKEFEGMTRMQVLVMRQNKNLAPLNWRTLCRDWGYETKTSVKASSILTVQYREWLLSSPEVIDLFKPNNYECVAHWIPTASGEIESIYIYQDGKYIDECFQWDEFQEAVAERTEKDNHIMHRQIGRKQAYRKMMRDEKEKKTSKLKIFKTEQTSRAIESADRLDVLERVPDPAENYQLPAVEYDFSDLDYVASNAVNSL